MSYSPFKTQIPEKIASSSSEFIPTEEQLEASKRIRRFLNSTEKIFVLKGPAGTGKTSLMNFILKDCYKQGKLIAVSAFTNQATNLIARKTPFAVGITIYKLLGLTADETSAELKFKRPKDDSKKRSLVSDFDIIVLDEVSMVLDSDLNLLIKEINKMYSTTKLIIMGDKYQLEAIGQETESIAFTFENCFELKSIVRQAANSNIIRYATEVRKIQDQIDNNEKIPIKTKLKPELNPDVNDLILLKDSKSFLEMMLNDFKSDDYQNFPDFVKCIAYRNVTIDKINMLIRKNIFGENVDLITVGENITLSSFVSDPETGINLYDSSDCLEITSILESSIYDNRENHHGVRIQFPYYRCLTSRRFDGLNGEMNIINPNFKQKFEADVSEWGKIIKTQEKCKDIYRLQFYPFKKKFHSVKYNYAGTAHSNQGGTFSHVYFVEDDAEAITKATIKGLWKSKYVAYTRASKKLIILNRFK